MPVPETSRQYLPNLEARWKLGRRKILELARDGKLALWIAFLDGVCFCYRASDGSRKVETSNSLELKISTDSLERLCEHAELESYPHIWHAEGRVKSSINGFLRDGRQVEVWRAKPAHLQPGYCGPSVWIQIHFSKVFADLEKVESLDWELDNDWHGRLSSTQEPLRATVHQVADSSQTKRPAGITDQQSVKNKNGRPKSQLRQGIEALYLEKFNAGQTDILLGGAVEAFMGELRRIIGGDTEFSDKISEHIRKVSKPSGQWVVHVQDPPDTGGKVMKRNEKPDGYRKKDVSKILSDLRKLHPIE